MHKTEEKKKFRLAAKKAWKTIKSKKTQKASKNVKKLDRPPIK